MTSTKISSKLITLSFASCTSCDTWVPQSSNYQITQPDANSVALGVMSQSIYFGGKAEKWSYTNIDCGTDTEIASVKAINTERISMRGGWRTFYFNDIETGQQIGTAIVAELKNSAADYDPTDTTPAQISIYFDIQGSHPGKGTILCPIGTKRINIVAKYDSVAAVINVIILGIDGFTYHSFGINCFVADKPMIFTDAMYSSEYSYSGLNENSFSPDGNLVLLHNLPHSTTDSSDDEDYFSIALVNKKYGQLTESMAKYKFKTYGKLFCNNQITWSRDQITVMCYAGRLIFNLISGESGFVEEGIQNVNLHFKNWQIKRKARGHSYTVKGLSWRVPRICRPQPMRTFMFEDDIQDDHEYMMIKINKSIPASNISLDWALFFENDNIAVFKIGHKIIIGFDKLLHYQPVVYQLPKTTDYYDIVAITRDRIYTSTFIDDEDEYGGYGGQIKVLSYQFDFATQIERFIRIDKLPGMSVGGGAFNLIAKFLAHQKKN